MVDERTAYKLFISDITERPLNIEEGKRPFIDYNGFKISTVRAMGTVVSRYEAENFTILTVDDGTETISVRAFGEDKGRFSDLMVGEIVDVIGSLREYEEETYISPYTVSKIDDPNWETVRNLELLIRAKKSGIKVSEGGAEVEEVLEEDHKAAVLELVEKIDEGDGAEYREILKVSGLEESQLDVTLNDLLSNSDIYEPKIGKFKKV